MMRRAVFIRLAAFVLVVAGSFGVAYGVGRMLPGKPESHPHTLGHRGDVVTAAFTVVEP